MKMDFVFPGFIFFYIIISSCDALRREGFCSKLYHTSSDCPSKNFLCKNKKCIGRELFGNGRDDCGDNSDEAYLYYGGDCHFSMYTCRKPNGYTGYTCIPYSWFCDGIPDCPNSEDETQCRSLGNENFIRNRTLLWLISQRNPELSTESWGSQVDKSAVALYLANSTFAIKGNRMWKEIGYEVSIQLLSRLSKKKLREIPAHDIASYVNAFLVTCVNPRKFHGMDLIQELRSRADGQNYTIPYVLLALCNAGETITELDTRKLLEAFWVPRRTFWTDIQAFVVMALACAQTQPGNPVDSETLDELVVELKQHQYSNGTVENLQTTALVLQALIAADPNPDPKTFDESKALRQIYDMQKSDGSFGSFLDTYYVLPVLHCRSLVNISTDHCQYSDKDEISALEELRTRSGPKIRVRYSLWIGNDKDLEWNMALRVPANMSFYSAMEMAAEVDTRYRFEYVLKNSKPYVNAVSDIKDNPEKNKFWFLYTFVNGNPVPSQESPVDIVPKDHQHFVMWYRSGSWVEQKRSFFC